MNPLAHRWVNILAHDMRRLEGQLPDLQQEAQRLVERVLSLRADHHLFDARPHELTQCAGCGETHDCALAPTGLIAMGRPANEQLVALCASCYIPKRWRTRDELAAH